MTITGKFVVSLFKTTAKGEIKGFNVVLNPFRLLDIEPEVETDVGSAAVMLAHGGPVEFVLDT